MKLELLNTRFFCSDKPALAEAAATDDVREEEPLRGTRDGVRPAGGRRQLQKHLSGSQPGQETDVLISGCWDVCLDVCSSLSVNTF